MALFDALRERAFRRFFLGQAVSQLGDGVFFVALSWQALQVGGGSGAALGAVLTAYFAAQVSLLVAGGLIVDRFPRQRVVVASDVAQGILAAVVAALVFTGSMTLPLLVGMGALFGAAAAIAMPALSAFVPETVPPERLASANSLYHQTRMAAFFLGPLLGAALIKWGGEGMAFAFDAATFALSAAILASLGRLPSRAQPARGRSLVHDVREGARYVMATPWLWMTIALFTLVNFAENGPRTVSLPLLLTGELGLGVEALGYALSSHTAGAFVGLGLMGWLMPRRHRGIAAYALTGASGVFLLLMGFVSHPWAVFAMFFLFGASIAGFNLIWETTLGDTVEPGIRGRVVSLDMLGSFALLPVSTSFFGWLGDRLDPRFGLAGGGITIVLCAIVGLLVPAAHRFGQARPATQPDPAHGEPAEAGNLGQ